MGFHSFALYVWNGNIVKATLSSIKNFFVLKVRCEVSHFKLFDVVDAIPPPFSSWKKFFVSRIMMKIHHWPFSKLLKHFASRIYTDNNNLHYRKTVHMDISVNPWICILALIYSRFQITFHCNIPNFVAKFGNSLRSSKVHFRIRKPVCKLSIWLASMSSGTNHSLCLRTGLWILKWTFELRNEFPKFATKFGILQWKVTWNRL